MTASLMKYAPSFCSVYVVSKGKILSLRMAPRPLSNAVTPPKQSLSSLVGLPPPPDHCGEEHVAIRYIQYAYSKH